MKLLFDQNLPPRLVDSLADAYPGSQHVAAVGLDRASDLAISKFAEEHDLTVVTKDADFAELAQSPGADLTVIWIRLGNRRTAEIEAALRDSRDAVRRLEESPDARVLLIE